MLNRKIMLWSLLILIVSPGCFWLGLRQPIGEPPEPREEFITAVPVTIEPPEPRPIPTEVVEVIPPPDFTLKLVLGPHEDVGTLTQDDLQLAAEIIETRLSAADIDFVMAGDDDAEEFTLLTNASSETILPLLTQVGFLELVDFSGLEAVPEDGGCILTTAQQERYPTQQLCPNPVADGSPFETVITGDGVVSAEAELATGQVGAWQVLVMLDEDGSQVLDDFTATHIGEPLAIVLDGEVISAPTVQSRIVGEFSITGNFTAQEAQDLARVLSSRALPFSMQVVEMDTLP